jgi:uncharacterized repeat protein (TIGR01451 family)
MRHTRKIAAVGLSSAALFAVKVAVAEAPPAGTVIGNVATATYYDENNNKYVSTSNLVQTKVKQVYAVDVNKQVDEVEAIPGQVLNIPFTVKNEGNGNDTLTLEATSNSTDITIEGIYLDKNNNGVVDPGEEKVDQVDLNMGESVPVIVVAKVSPDAQPDTQAGITLKATSKGDPTKSDSDTTKVNVVSDAVLQISMAVDKSVAKPGDTLTYTVDFTNTGNKPANATTVNIDGNNKEGILVYSQIPKDTTFVADSVQGTPVGGQVVYSTDNGNTWTTQQPQNLEDITNVGYFIPDDNPTDGQKTAVLDPDQQGSLTFKVQVVDKPTSNEILNNATAEYASYNDGSQKTAKSNTVKTQIPASETASVDICCDSTVKNVPAGSWAEFKHTVTNNGTNPDVINLEYNATNLPPGSVVEFWNGDGTAKLIDTNGDGKIDVGELPAGENATVTVKVFVPADADNGTYTLDIIASSSLNPDKTDKVTDTIDGIITSSVDIAKVNAAGDGDNTNDNITLNDNGTDGIINKVNPGETIYIPFEVVNNGGSPDSFGITVDNLTINGAVAEVYKDTNGDHQINGEDQKVTNTGLLGGTTLKEAASSGSKTITVYNVANFKPGDKVIVGTGTDNRETLTVDSVDPDKQQITFKEALQNDHQPGEKVSEVFYGIVKVDVPPDATAQTGQMNVTAKSANSDTSDTMSAQYEVLKVYDVSVSPDNNAQIPPGGTVTYQHTVKNLSNTNAEVQITVPTDTKLSYVILDENKNPQGTTYSVNLKPGESSTFYVKAVAPSSVEPGTVESIPVNATIKDENGKVLASDTATDTTTIIQGYLQLTKYAKDANCQNEISEIEPGGIICYQIKYQNIGTQKALNVVITDPIPQYTQYEPNSLCLDTNCDGQCDTNLTDSAGDDAAEYDSSNNKVVFRVGENATATKGGTLNPGQGGCVIFKVKVNQ